MSTLAQLVEDNLKYELVFENDSLELFMPVAVRGDEYDLESYIDEKGDYCIEVEFNDKMLIEEVEWANVKYKPSEYNPAAHSHLADTWLLNLMQGYSPSNHSHATEQWLINMFDGYALRSYVDTKFSQVVNGAPLALDNLQEIAAAIDNDPNFSDTILGFIAEKADASDVLTPVPVGAIFTDTQLTNQQVVDAVNAILGYSGWQSPPLTNAEVKAAYEANSNTNAFTDAEKSKLAGLEGPKWKGSFTTLAALEAAHPTGEAGWEADVDGGVGSDVVRYIWDDTDAKWVEQLGISTAETAASIKSKYESNPDTNAFTDALLSKLNEAYGWGNHASLYAALNHTHDYSTVFAAIDHLHTNVYEPVITTKNSAFNLNLGTSAGTVCEGNDSRLSDARTPVAHNQTLSTITDAGSIAGKNFWSGTQAQYDALTPDSNTIYFITE
ncbi:hypothetical protein KDU71_07385 [Carboxylicivirga sediminis]|uniref:Minor tail protein gp31 C-terminal domain-containing protein n=1 Tax=Carboxylicivirga sediminis TaxID=2006564 RepID=A0A941IX95_9BACT|nr:hypothetical protein [Carboxylicivirga sediminis]MBR8535378.1 hypothetical protein [Carboxylicivirga sediminis]